MINRSTRHTLGFFLLFIIIGISLIVGLQLGLETITDPQKYLGCVPVNYTHNINQTVAFWMDKSLTPTQVIAGNFSDSPKTVLGAASGQKWIEIDLTKQILIARQGSNIFLQTPVSTGLYNRTPVGNFHILNKYPSVTLEGGSHLNQTYYYLPNVPYSQYFTDKFSFRGSYWHQDFGYRVGFGCIDMPIEAARQLYYWTDTRDSPTRLIIH